MTITMMHNTCNTKTNAIAIVKEDETPSEELKFLRIS